MNNWLKNNWLRVLAILFLLGALGDWEYGYYQLLRWAVFIAGAYSAYIVNKKHRNAWVWIFGAVAILFNPILPVYLTRDTWQILDIITAVIFFVSFLLKTNKNLMSV